MTEPALIDSFGLVGTTLEHQYRVDRIVGEGGFGIVYKGWHLSLDQPIAIKVLKVLADDPRIQDQLLAKFRDEAKLLYTLSQASLHIVRSMDFGAVHSPSGAWAPFMVLEWLEGQSLSDDLDRRRANGLRGRSIDEVLPILAPAAEGLSVAHQRRIAHRDVKPANFFLLSGPNSQGMKVLDFGIAKILREDDRGSTKGTLASFTWLYAAPEQLDPRYGATGLATDVYSFALVLTEMLSDAPPVDAQDVVTLMRATTDPVTRPTPRRRGANVSDAVEAVCRRALAVDPQQRYANIAELWTALGQAASPRASVTPATQASPRAAPPPSSVLSRDPQGAQGQGGRASLVSNAGAPPRTAVPFATQPSAGTMPHASPFGPPAPAGPLAPYAPYAPTQPAMMPPAPPRPMMRPPSSNGALIAAVVVLVLGTLFVGSCALLHACLS